MRLFWTKWKVRPMHTSHTREWCTPTRNDTDQRWGKQNLCQNENFPNLELHERQKMYPRTSQLTFLAASGVLEATLRVGVAGGSFSFASTSILGTAILDCCVFTNFSFNTFISSFSFSWLSSRFLISDSSSVFDLRTFSCVQIHLVYSGHGFFLHVRGTLSRKLKYARAFAWMRAYMCTQARGFSLHFRATRTYTQYKMRLRTGTACMDSRRRQNSQSTFSWRHSSMSEILLACSRMLLLWQSCGTHIARTGYHNKCINSFASQIFLHLATRSTYTYVLEIHNSCTENRLPFLPTASGVLLSFLQFHVWQCLILCCTFPAMQNRRFQTCLVLGAVGKETREKEICAEWISYVLARCWSSSPSQFWSSQLLRSFAEPILPFLFCICPTPTSGP